MTIPDNAWKRWHERVTIEVVDPKTPLERTHDPARSPFALWNTSCFFSLRDLGKRWEAQLMLSSGNTVGFSGTWTLSFNGQSIECGTKPEQVWYQLVEPRTRAFPAVVHAHYEPYEESVAGRARQDAIWDAPIDLDLPLVQLGRAGLEPASARYEWVVPAKK